MWPYAQLDSFSRSQIGFLIKFNNKKLAVIYKNGFCLRAKWEVLDTWVAMTSGVHACDPAMFIEECRTCSTLVSHQQQHKHLCCVVRGAMGRAA